MSETTPGYGDDAPVATPLTSLDEARQNRERRARIQTALRQGELIASADMREGEYFMMAHRAIMRALGRANQLTAKQRQFLTVLMEYSYGNQSRHAVTDLQEKRPPRVADWCAWLGAWPAKQVMNIRRELLALHVIVAVDGDLNLLAVNETWEEWDTTVFTRHAAHKGTGRPKKQQADSPSDSPMAIGNSGITSTGELPNGHARITDGSPVNYPVVIPELPEAGTEARNGAGRSKRIRMEEGKKGRSRTETNVSGAVAPLDGQVTAAETAHPIATDHKKRAPIDQEAWWPRQADETERDCWLRRAGIATSQQRLPVLMLLAHEKLNVSLERNVIIEGTRGLDAWGFMASMAKQHGGQLMVQFIFEASAHQILGHPMKYLYGVTDRPKARKEARAVAAHAAMPPTPAAASTTSTIPTIKTNLNPERFAAEAAAKARQKARQEAH